MRLGTALSVMLHGALAALVLMTWHKEPLEPPQETNTVDVEMVTISDETNVMAAAEPAPQPPAPTPPPVAPSPPPPPPQVEPETAAPPPPPRPPEPPRERQAALPPKTEPRPQTRTKPEPKPEPKEPEPKKPEPKKEEAKKPEPKTPEPQQPAKKVTQTAEADPKKPEKKAEKPKPKKDAFNLDDIGAAADKLAKSQEPKPEQPAAKPSASGPRAAAGRGTKMTASEIDALRSVISQCWNVPAGAPNPETLIVRLKLFLNADGTVARPPELIDTAGRAGSDPYFRAAAEAAMRAVQVCAPYNLPSDKYDDWSEITINFRPPF